MPRPGTISAMHKKIPEMTSDKIRLRVNTSGDGCDTAEDGGDLFEVTTRWFQRQKVIDNITHRRKRSTQHPSILTQPSLF